MTRDFLKEFQERIKRLDREDLPQEQIEAAKKKQEIPENVKLYNIHKRSLPVGLDKVVIFSITKEDAEWWIEHKLKSKCYHNDADDSKTLIYYDVIPVDATPREKNLFFNTSPVTTEPVIGFNTPRRVN